VKTVLSVLLLLALAALPVHAKKIADIDLPETLNAAGTTLQLNGAGVRKKVWVSIYVGGLYLTAKSSDSGYIIAADQPMALKLHIVSGLVSSEAMEEATTEGFEKTTGGNTAPLTESIEAFMAVFSEPIAEGDVFDIIHIPGEGIEVYKNGTFKSSVDGGMAFKRALFGIWLGDKPADKDLRDGMLAK
jgi:hypothetical protein